MGCGCGCNSCGPSLAAMGLGYLEPETLQGPPRPMAWISKGDVEAYRDFVAGGWRQLDVDFQACPQISLENYRAFFREYEAWQVVARTDGYYFGNSAFWSQIEAWEQRLAAWQKRGKEWCELHAPDVQAPPEDQLPSLIKWVVVGVVVVSGVYAARLVLK